MAALLAAWQVDQVVSRRSECEGQPTHAMPRKLVLVWQERLGLHTYPNLAEKHPDIKRWLLVTLL